jgi:hypothetical protein
VFDQFYEILCRGDPTLNKWLWILCTLIVSGCVVKNNPPNISNDNRQIELASLANVELDDYGPAPELTNDIWLNSEEPLRLKELRGKVILLEMWTFG